MPILVENKSRLARGGERLVDELMRFKPEAVSANQWAISAGVARSVWTDMRRHGNPSRRTLEKLLGVAGSSLAEFEALRVSPGSAAGPSDEDLSDAHWGWRGAPLVPLPLFCCVAAGDWGEQRLELWSIDRSRAIAQLPRPPSLSADLEVFAVAAPSAAMAPRLRSGRYIAISPAAPLEPDCDLFVVLEETGSARLGLAGQFVGHEGAGIVIRQYRGARRATVPNQVIASLAVIVGELI